jgi:hypothetical protein
MLIKQGLEKQAVHLAILQGARDEGQLTNRIFFGRHPERSGQKIQKHERNLADEWIHIRNTIVRPALGGGAPKSKPAESTPGNGAKQNCSSANGCTTRERRIQAAIPRDLVSVPRELLYYTSRPEHSTATPWPPTSASIQRLRRGISVPAP